MRKLYLYIFSLFVLFLFKINNIYSQNGLYDISSIDNATTVIETNPNSSANNYKAFWAQQCSNPSDAYNCGGFEGASGKNVVTPEALNLTLTSTIRNSLNVGGTYTEYADDLNSVSVVNVYMVYLNSSVNWRTNPGEIVFEGEILGVYSDYDQTLYFNGSNFQPMHTQFMLALKRKVNLEIENLSQVITMVQLGIIHGIILEITMTGIV